MNLFLTEWIVLVVYGAVFVHNIWVIEGCVGGSNGTSFYPNTRDTFACSSKSRPYHSFDLHLRPRVVAHGDPAIRYVMILFICYFIFYSCTL